ncbi:MAG: conserved membrane protein of unknown function [Promethearchaeota archaeon]|nr:MAG: conserved membrane protein of unknown function [Candidatus Lokiarchaeota archaeon]
MELSIWVQLSGVASLISISIAIFFSIFILVRANKYRDKDLYKFFFITLFVLSPWYPGAFGYLYWLFTNHLLPYEIYVLIGTNFIPLYFLLWLDVYLTKTFPDKKKAILIIYSIFSIILEIYVVYFLFVAPGAPVKELLPIVYPERLDHTYSGFILVYSLTCIITALITGVHFSLVAMKKSKDKIIQWKGRFLFIAFILFVGIMFLDSTLVNPIVISIIRILFVADMTFFYFGFILPKPIEKLLIKAEN